RRGERVEWGERAGRRDVETGAGRFQRRPLELIEIDERVGRDLRFREQPGTAGEPGVPVTPLRDLIRRRRAFHLGDGIEVHAELLPEPVLRQCRKLSSPAAQARPASRIMEDRRMTWALALA